MQKIKISCVEDNQEGNQMINSKMKSICHTWHKIKSLFIYYFWTGVCCVIVSLCVCVCAMYVWMPQRRSEECVTSSGLGVTGGFKLIDVDAWSVCKNNRFSSPLLLWFGYSCICRLWLVLEDWS